MPCGFKIFFAFVVTNLFFTITVYKANIGSKGGVKINYI